MGMSIKANQRIQPYALTRGVKCKLQRDQNHDQI